MVSFIGQVLGHRNADTGAFAPSYTVPHVTYPADYNGEKFVGGYGATPHFAMDYHTLRARSAQLYRENLYGRGVIRRLVTNIINTGLMPELTPEASILKMSEQELTEWSDTVEARFGIYANAKKLVSVREDQTWGQVQTDALTEALVCGDAVIVSEVNPRNNLPRFRVIPGDKVVQPANLPDNLPKGVEIRHGVEVDADGRHLAYWVRGRGDGSLEAVRIPCVGARSGRRISWMVYGTDKRHDDVRGEPILSLGLQSLKEIDRYRDAAQRKATINSILTMTIEKASNKPGTLPMQGSAQRRGSLTGQDAAGNPTQFRFSEHVPGLVLSELQTGEKPTPYSTAGTDLNLGGFEEVVISGLSWAFEIPPEILRLAFSSNYSASQAAINEFKMFLTMRRTNWGADFCAPAFEEWFISEALMRKFEAGRFLQAFRNPALYDEYQTWLSCEWAGAIKPSTDLSRQTRGYQTLVAEGWISNERASRELTGTKFRKNIRRLKRENELKLEARRAGEAEDAAAQTGAQTAYTAVILEALEGLEQRFEERFEELKASA